MCVPAGGGDAHLEPPGGGSASVGQESASLIFIFLPYVAWKGRLIPEHPADPPAKILPAPCPRGRDFPTRPIRAASFGGSGPRIFFWGGVWLFRVSLEGGQALSPQNKEGHSVPAPRRCRHRAAGARARRMEDVWVGGRSGWTVEPGRETHPGVVLGEGN